MVMEDVAEVTTATSSHLSERQRQLVASSLPPDQRSRYVYKPMGVEVTPKGVMERLEEHDEIVGTHSKLLPQSQCPSLYEATTHNFWQDFSCGIPQGKIHVEVQVQLVYLLGVLLLCCLAEGIHLVY